MITTHLIMFFFDSAAETGTAVATVVKLKETLFMSDVGRMMNP